MGWEKQNIISLSTTEAEYVCLSNAAWEATWLHNLYAEIGFPQKEPTLIYSNNLSALAIAENPHYHKRTKHFNIKHHYIHDQIDNKNMITKYLQAHELHMKSLGLYPAWRGVLRLITSASRVSGIEPDWDKVIQVYIFYNIEIK